MQKTKFRFDYPNDISWRNPATHIKKKSSGATDIIEIAVPRVFDIYTWEAFTGIENAKDTLNAHNNLKEIYFFK